MKSTVLFLHAFPLDSRMWDAVRGALEAKGWPVLAPDLGEGDSMGAWAERILGEGDERLVPVGSSMGGYLAFELWRRAPERIAALGLVGTKAGADSPEAREGRDSTIALVGEQGVGALWELLGPKLTVQLNGRAESIALEQDPVHVVNAVKAIRDREDSTGLLPDIDVPVLVVAGREDAMIPPSESEAMAAALPHAHLVLLQGVGHLPALELPDALSAELLRFLAGLR